MAGYFGICDILKIGCFLQNPKIHENCKSEFGPFWPISISNHCQRQTVWDKWMKPIVKYLLGTEFLQEKSLRSKYLPSQEKRVWTSLVVENQKLAADGSRRPWLVVCSRISIFPNWKDKNKNIYFQPVFNCQWLNQFVFHNNDKIRVCHTNGVIWFHY